MTTQDKLPPTQSFEQLIAWQKAHQFVLQVYRLTEHFPQKEIYGLTSQFRRAAISVPANIAEGYKKIGRLDKIRFFNIAQGSLEECHYYLILTRDLGYGDIAPLLSLLDETGKLLQAYSSAIRRRVLFNASVALFGLSSLLSVAFRFL
jgi:four helix bundle protein